MTLPSNSCIKPSRWNAERRRVEASIQLGAVNREDGIRQIALQRYPSSAVEHDGRQGRRPAVVEDWDGDGHDPLAFALDRDIVPEAGGDVRVEVEFFDENVGGDAIGVIYDGVDDRQAQSWHGPTTGDATWRTFAYDLPNAAFHGRQRDEHEADFTLQVPEGVAIGKVTVTNADEIERRTVAYYTIHDPTQGETLPQGLHLRGWTDATQPIADLDLDGLQAIYAWDAEAASWLLYSPDVPARFNTLNKLEQGRAYYVRVRNGETLHWPDAPYGGVGFPPATGPQPRLLAGHTGQAADRRHRPTARDESRAAGLGDAGRARLRRGRIALRHRATPLRSGAVGGD